MATMAEKTVWKFALGYNGRDQFEIQVPPESRPLRVDFDPTGELSLWALVDPNVETRVPAIVTVVGTGRLVPDNPGDFVSTLISAPFVFHAFYREAS